MLAWVSGDKVLSLRVNYLTTLDLSFQIYKMKRCSYMAVEAHLYMSY